MTTTPAWPLAIDERPGRGRARRRTPPRTWQRARLRTGGLLLTGTLLAACNPTYYAPSTQNVPLLREQGEVVGLAATDGNRFEAQGAYAATDHLALVAGASLFRPSDVDNGNGGSGHLIEGGVGYFTALDDALTFEVQGLLAAGAFDNDFPAEGGASAGRIEGTLLRWGLQPALGYRWGRVEAAASTRLAQLRYSGLSGDLVHDGVDQVARLRDAPAYWLLEPALTLRGGTGRVMVQLQTGWSVNLTEADFSQDDSFLTVGVLFRLPGSGARP